MLVGDINSTDTRYSGVTFRAISHAGWQGINLRPRPSLGETAAELGYGKNLIKNTSQAVCPAETVDRQRVLGPIRNAADDWPTSAELSRAVKHRRTEKVSEKILYVCHQSLHISRLSFSQALTLPFVFYTCSIFFPSFYISYLLFNSLK